MGFAVAMATVLAAPPPAWAHERREVGKYQLVVGFNVEPALQGEPNGVQLTVTSPSENNRAVEGLADTVRTTVAFGGGPPKEFRLRAAFGSPGRYIADLIPTRAGSYVFTFSGTIEGTPLNERFESGPGRFNDVEAVTPLQFPEAIPPANEAVREAQAAAQRVDELEAKAAAAETRATLGMGVGLLGVLLGIGALVFRRGHP